MPIVLYSFRKTTDGIMFHGFMAPNAKAAEKMELAHAAICPVFGPALQAEQTIEIEVEESELPEFDEESLEEFLDADPDEDEDEEVDEGETDEPEQEAEEE
jgi:hypothetical protein